jgi:acyl-coenzyme A thioesterase PaaI-like protein
MRRGQRSPDSEAGPIGEYRPPVGRALPAHVAELLRDGLIQAIPFNVHNEGSIQEIGVGYGVATIPDAEHLKNHLGTQHGIALCAVAEAAAGAACLGAFVDHLGEIRINLQEIKMTYQRWARGRITAKSQLSDSPQAILALLRRRGRFELHLATRLLDSNGEQVAEGSVRFLLKETGAKVWPTPRDV